MESVKNSNLFDCQPLCCREPLPIKKLYKIRGGYPNVVKRILFYDPKQQFENIKLLGDSFKRHQISKINFNMLDLFPSLPNKLCSCGCGNELIGKRRRWATKECEKFGFYVFSILCGRLHEIRICLRSYYGGDVCVDCGSTNCGIEIDHIIPVHKGGGCCWLSNLKPLCIDCHKNKTKNDKNKLYYVL